jgi:methyl-accepting chemotaxis protein
VRVQASILNANPKLPVVDVAAPSDSRHEKLTILEVLPLVKAAKSSALPLIRLVIKALYFGIQLAISHREGVVRKMDNMDNNTDRNSKNKWIFPVLAGAVALSLGFNGYQAFNLQELRQQVSGVHKQVGEFREGLARVDQEYANNIGAVREEVGHVRAEAKNNAVNVSQTALSAVKKNADMVARLAKKEEANNIQMAAEITKVKDSTEQAASKITDVFSEVGNVKTDVASTKTDIEATKNDLSKTIAELKRATGDMGVMSGLIATNGTELQALRALGERDYYEFKINKNSQPQRVGDIQLALKRSDTKHNRFTVEVTADDKRIEKKDKTVNEPVQFYVASKARQPYEIVVNQITKDSVSGYLAKPKVTVARR